MKGYDGFFIGWSNKWPKGLRRFLPAIGLGLIGGFAGLGFSIGATQDDPGDGAFRFDFGRQSVVGVLESDPYPFVHVVESEQYQVGHTVMLTGGGKRGPGDRAVQLDGQIVEAEGVPLKRGELDMIQLRGGMSGLRAAEARDVGNAVLPEPQSLGKWRLTGEICDGKCLAGAMRPGRGVAHKACANLCLEGGLPPVFVSTGHVEGEFFFLMADPEGKPVDEAVLDYTAVLIEVEGEVERRGSLLIFKIDPATMRVL